MSNYSIYLKPVYSSPAGEELKDVKLPQNWKLSWHQVETLKALRDPNIDVIINTAMTGDGKSLAAYLEVLQGEFSAIGLYPTNELARDQEIQIKGYIDTFKPANNPRIAKLSSAELEVYAENEGLRKSAAISTLTTQREIIFTNPDILHYLHRGAYLVPSDSPDKLWGKIDKDFDLFIFDEFHVFAAPQIAGVINTMLLINCTNRRNLKKQGLVCYVLRHPVAEVRNRLSLPMHFQLYPICDQYSVNDSSAPYAIAFGQSALLLDTLAYRFKSKGDESWIV